MLLELAITGDHADVLAHLKQLFQLVEWTIIYLAGFCQWRMGHVLWANDIEEQKGEIQHIL